MLIFVAVRFVIDSMSYGRRGPPPNTEGMVSLKVDNLTFRTREDTLKRVFEKYGDVGDVYIPRDPFSQESRGFAFVRYYDERDADDAIEAIDGTVLDGREIRVKLAKHPRPVQSFYRGSGGPSSRSRPRRRYQTFIVTSYDTLAKLLYMLQKECVCYI